MFIQAENSTKRAEHVKFLSKCSQPLNLTFHWNISRCGNIIFVYECVFNKVYLMESKYISLTFRYIRPYEHTTARCSPRLKIWHAERMMQSQMAAVSLAKRRRDRLMIGTWCDRHIPDVSSTRYQNNPSCHLEGKLTF